MFLLEDFHIEGVIELDPTHLYSNGIVDPDRPWQCLVRLWSERSMRSFITGDQIDNMGAHHLSYYSWEQTGRYCVLLVWKRVSTQPHLITCAVFLSVVLTCVQASLWLSYQNAGKQRTWSWGSQHRRHSRLTWGIFKFLMPRLRPRPIKWALGLGIGIFF